VVNSYRYPDSGIGLSEHETCNITLIADEERHAAESNADRASHGVRCKPGAGARHSRKSRRCGPARRAGTASRRFLLRARKFALWLTSSSVGASDSSVRWSFRSGHRLESIERARGWGKSRLPAWLERVQDHGLALDQPGTAQSVGSEGLSSRLAAPAR
jgi:hypothetical protein